jgi:hypothetical protein
MPIIPSNWTGLDTVNAIGGSGGLTGYAYAKQLTTTITELDTFIDLIGPCNEPISREVSLDLITGRLKLYWKNLDGTYTQLHRDNLVFNTGYKVVDLTLGQLGLSIKCSEVTELFLVVRWDKDIEFNVYGGGVPTTPLIMVIDNTFYIDQSEIANHPEGVTCYAYFDTIPAATNRTQIKLFITNLDWSSGLPEEWVIDRSESPPLEEWVESIPPSEEVYPTIDNKFSFNLLPNTITEGLFYRFWSIPDWKSGNEQLSIISYDDLTKNFILGLITE